MRTQFGEHLIEQRIGNAAGDPLGDPRPVEADPIIAVGLHRVVVGIGSATATIPREREWIDHRTRPDIAVEVVEDPQDRL